MLYLIAQEVANHQIKPLTNSQLISMFSQESKVNEVISYLQNKGFKVVYKSPFEVMVEAPVSIVSSLFNTKFILVQSSNGEIYYKPEGEVSIPTQLHNLLIGGLTNFSNVQIP